MKSWLMSQRDRSRKTERFIRQSSPILVRNYIFLARNGMNFGNYLDILLPASLNSSLYEKNRLESSYNISISQIKIIFPLFFLLTPISGTTVAFYATI
jgi:hypothetical protein